MGGDGPLGGRWEVEMVVYDDEGHGLIKRANRLIAYPAIARFLAEHIGG